MTRPLESPEPLGDTLVAEQEQLETGDHERFAHYVRKDKVVDSAVFGEPLVALCGKVWVPSRDPSRFPVCPQCKAILDGFAKGGEPDGADG